MAYILRVCCLRCGSRYETCLRALSVFTGWTYGTWNGPAGQLPRNAFNASGEIFVLKLTQSGDYQWHTFYGSPAIDNGWAIALDSSSNIYVEATAAPPGTGRPHKPRCMAYTGGVDMTVLKLNSAGDYQWHTFYGSMLHDYFSAIAIDGSATST